MQKIKTFWYSFQRSLLDVSYYRDIAKSSLQFSLQYLFFLLVCLSLIRSIQLGFGYTLVRKSIPSFIQMGMKEIAQLYPKELELRISNGKLYTNVQEPYIIEFPKAVKMPEKHLLVIDTEGSADEYPQYNTILLATRQSLVYPDRQVGNNLTTKLYYFKDLKKSLYIDYALYSKMASSLRPLAERLPRIVDVWVVVGLLLFPFVGGLFWLIGILFGLSMLTILIWLVEKILKTSYGYKTLFRMGMHGATWAILFSFLLDFTRQDAHPFNMIFILWMLYVLYTNRMKLSAEKTHI